MRMQIILVAKATIQKHKSN